MNIAIVVPNWNGAEWLTACLDSLQQQSVKAEIIVVDNGSTDDSLTILQKSFPKITVLTQKQNLGFAGGVNVGIRHALEHGAEYVALFNNDAAATPHWLKALLDTMKAHSQAGMVTGKFMRMDKKRLDSTGECYSIWGMPFPRGRNQLDTGQHEQPGEVFGATGGATLYRARMFQEIGLFDERFFAYMEDIDISFRARLAGWTVLYEPAAVAYHHVGATSSRLGTFARYHFIKNFHLTYHKNMPGWLFWKYFPLAALQTGRLAAGSLIRGHFLTYLRAHGAAVRMLPGSLAERRRIQQNRKVSISEIDQLLYHRRPPRIP